MQILAFLVTWAILGAGITTWMSSLGLAILLAAIIGLIVGGIVNLLAWIIFSNGSTNFDSWPL